MSNPSSWVPTDIQWIDLISEGLHVALLDDVGAKVAAESVLMGFCSRYDLPFDRLYRLQLANEINGRLD